MKTTTYHNPVLLKESVSALNIDPDGIYIDVTFGGGGHSKGILSHLSERGCLYAFDQDVDAIENAIADKRFKLISKNFKYLSHFLKFYGITKVDGIICDLGVSSHQIDTRERGFSTRFDAKLDMRMNQNTQCTACDIVNQYSQNELSRILFKYGELKNANAMAKTIVSNREKEKIETTFQLKEILNQFLPEKKMHKILARVFQSLRIEVNQELESLKEFLLQIPNVLKRNGRFCIISYHSLEDRLIKRFIQKGIFEGEVKKDFYGNFIVVHALEKVGNFIIPGEEEIKMNKRARSAKLRIAALRNKT